MIVKPHGGSQFNNLFDVNSGGTSILDVNRDNTIMGNKVGIGTGSFSFPTNEPYRLYVKGGIRSEKVTVDLASVNGWGDFVFDKTYRLKPLYEVETFITENSHLPNIPSAKEIEAEGIDLGEMQRLQMIKIEELTLYMIELKKQNDALATNMALLQKQNEALNTQIELLKK